MKTCFRVKVSAPPPTSAAPSVAASRRCLRTSKSRVRRAPNRAIAGTDPSQLRATIQGLYSGDTWALTQVSTARSKCTISVSRTSSASRAKASMASIATPKASR
ncbi:hypothetical protein D3C87_1509220 [compost metagenome]